MANAIRDTSWIRVVSATHRFWNGTIFTGRLPWQSSTWTHTPTFSYGPCRMVQVQPLASIKGRMVNGEIRVVPRYIVDSSLRRQHIDLGM
jgi:hypothetical protein